MLTVSILIVCSILLFLFSIYKARQLTSARKELAKRELELTKEREKEYLQGLKIAELKNEYKLNINNDPLTGLPSRHIFEDRLEQIIQQSKRHHLIFGVAFLNIDSFDIINDALGLDAGDALLKEIGSRLHTSIRGVDTVCRFVGDEFVFILPQLNKPEGAAYVAQRLLETISQPLTVQGQEIFLTASIGLAIYPSDGETGKVLLKNANHALHKAKAQGHNTYQYYQKDMDILSRRELLLSTSLHSAAIYNDFVLYYQPEINSKNQKIIGTEALLRWNHPDFGLIEFNDFCRIAENSGNIIAIGEWVLHQAATQFIEWQNAGLAPEKLIVKISARQLENPHFIFKLTQILQEAKLDSNKLVLELSELMLVTKFEIIEKTLLMLKQNGIQLGVGDFGSGQFSLRHLVRFPMDRLKIVKNLVQDVTVNKEADGVIKMLVALGKTLNIEIIANGVSAQKQVEILNEAGCELMQGEFFSGPLLAQDYELKLQKSIKESV